MGEMRDSDWSRQNLLRSDWLGLIGAICTTKSPYFEKHLFAKQELITRARLRGQDFATGKNFSFNQCHTKSFAFFLGKFIL